MGSCRKMWSLAVAAGLALSALGPAWAQPAAKLPAAIKAKGEVIVGIEGLFAPMEFKNPGSNDLIGFDVDLAKAIGKTLGVKVVFDDQKFDQLINSVTTQRVDFVISAISDSKARQKTLDFIDYFKSGTQVYTTKAYAGSIKSLDDLSGKTFAIQASTDFFPTIQRWSKEALEAKGKPGVTILPVDSEANARLQVVQGRAQASAISPEVLGWLMKQQPGKFVPARDAQIDPLRDHVPQGQHRTARRGPRRPGQAVQGRDLPQDPGRVEAGAVRGGQAHHQRRDPVGPLHTPNPDCGG